MAEDITPTAPAEAQSAPESVETPTNTTNEPVQAPDMHGFTSDQLADMKKFFDNNGGFDGVKAKISNPQRATENIAQSPEPRRNEELAPQQQVQKQESPVFKTPKGAITASEFLAQQYFKALAGEEKYAPIAKGIENGDYLKEMAAFGINALNQDGSINDNKVRMYLDLKAQTVPAKPTESEPNASAAPTVDYVSVGDKIENIDQAYKVIMQPNHPKMAMAEEFIKNHFNPNSGKK